MSSKKLFDKGKSYKVLSSVDPSTLGLDAESHRNIQAVSLDKDRFVPNVDFSSASNFVRYGSAKKYYETAFDRITNEYPYDGSSAEKEEFFNSSSYLDLYVFNNEYPTTTGYGVFSVSDDPDATAIAAATLTSATTKTGWTRGATTVEYIRLVGGPHTSSAGMAGKTIHSEFSDSNIYDSDIYDTEGVLSLGKQGTRESNLKFDLARGVSTEFWVNLNSVWPSNGTDPANQIIYDQWNGSVSSSAGYGRFLVFITGSNATGQDPIRVHLASGSNVWDVGFGGSTFTTASLKDTWNHIALTFVSSSTKMEANFYVNGGLRETKTNTSIALLGEVTGSLIAHIGAGQTAVSGATAATSTHMSNPFNPLSGSLDEFRYWKVERTHEEIAKNYFRHVDGGTNTDVSNTELGVYFKFNEGITGDTATDSTVLDYSGRISNGNWVNYPGVAARNTGSAIVSSSAAAFEVEDPIVYSIHSSVSSRRSELSLSGSAYDYQNNSSLYYSLPTWVIEEDEEHGEILNLTQIISSYFDTLHTQVNEIPRLKDVNYLSSSYKAYPFSNRLLESSGMFAPEVFVDASILEQIKGQSETKFYEKDLTEIKNLIYQNIYNNLVYIYKSKGTEKSFRNVIRCYGVDDELIKVNLYGNNTVHKIRDNFRPSVVKRRYVDFNHPTRFGSIVTHQTASSNANTVNVTAVSGSTNNVGRSRTAEAEVIFPRKLDKDNENFFATSFLSSSIFGWRRARYPGQDFGTHTGTGRKDLQLYAVRPFKGSKDAYFVLENPQQSTAAQKIRLTSSIYQDVYDDTKWNFAIRTSPAKGEQADYISGSAATGLVDIELYGCNVELGVVKNEFTVSTTRAVASAHHYYTTPRRYYAGATRDNITGSTVSVYSDVKVSSIRHWESSLSNEEIQAHAKNTDSYGVLRPLESAYQYDSATLGHHVPKIETLSFNWDFGDVTGSDASGEFLVNDFSSGSIAKRTRYRTSVLGHSLGNQHTGRGFHFPASSTDVVSYEYVQAAKQQPMEVVTSHDMTNIMDFDDEIFERDSRTINHFFAIEKSMYQTISEEMLNMFSTIVGFNNLIGEAVNKYRPGYKDMAKLRNLFFENVENEPDLDKYVDFYRWIDSSLSIILRQLIPASANTSEDVRTMIESHVLERNKYEHKAPSIEMKSGEIVASISGINSFDPDEIGLPNWRFAHAPVPVRATATITVADGDAASGMTEGEKITITSTDGTVRVYRLCDDTLTAVTTGTVLEAGSDTGAGTTGDAGDIAVVFNIASSEATQNAFLVQLKAAIESANGHGGKIIVSDVPTEANGAQLITLTQRDGGKLGNVTITDDISQTTLAGFTGGDDREDSNTIYWQYAEAAHPALDTGDVGVRATRDAIIRSKRTARDRRHGTPYKITSVLDSEDKPTRAGTGRRALHCGINYPRNKRADSFREALSFGTSKGFVFGNIENVVDISDVIHPMHKKYQNFEETNNDFKGETHAPFRVLSGSATGYNSGFSNFQVTNLHSDAYTPGGETPLQGPFTEKFVGGRESRHTAINRGSDTAANRAESWKLATTSTALTFSHPDTANPRDTISRSVKAKRPVNLESLKITGSTSLGNYSNIREVVQLSGRGSAGSQFVKNEGVAVSNITSTLVESIVDRQVTEFSSSAHSMIERFSAPGGYETSRGSLDAESGRYSVYSALPYRNLTVRTPLRTMLSASTSQFGFKPGVGASSADYGGIANFHKINKNTLRRIEYSNEYVGTAGTVASASVNDNFFITRPVPQSDLQYSWITASYESTPFGGSRKDGRRMLGYAARDFEVSTSAGYVNAITFVSESHVAGNVVVDFAGLNTVIVDQVAVATQNLGQPLNSAISSYETADFGNISEGNTLNAILSHRRATYGYNTWNQLRVGDHPVARALREGHKVSIETGDTQTYSSDGAVLQSQRYGNFKQYRESPIISKYKPIVQNSDNTVISSTYGNNKSYFSNLELDKVYEKPVRQQFYDKVKGRYSNFGYLRYRETVYPSEENVYDNRIRQRQGYSIDYWHSSRATRNADKANKTSLGGRSIYSLWALDAPAAFSTMAIPTALTEPNDPPGELQNKKTQVHNTRLINVTASATYALPHMLANTASFVSPSGVPIPETGSAPGVAPNTFGSAQIGAGAALWEAGSQAGRIVNGSFVSSLADRQVPAYDTYEDYADDLRVRNKDFSIIPEFRISDHIDFYVNQNNGDFLANNTSSFSIFGATVSSDYPTNSTQDGFYNVYTNSDFLKYFEMVQQDHKDIAKNHSITLRCKGLLKFLPYNGFYPAERTLQMATQFSSSYAKHVSYLGSHATYGNAKIRPFLEPMFAPGIVYNSIKSGIGVPYPVLTASFAVQRLQDSYYAISSSANGSGFRKIAFEAAVEPEKYLSDVRLVDMSPHPSCSLDLSASWNGQGDPLYRMMASNFFGEVPEFFLPQGNMTSLVSLPESDSRFGNAVSGNVYGMRVKMYRSMNKARTFNTTYPYPQDNPLQGGLHETFTMYSRPSAFFHAVSGRNAIANSQFESATYGDRVLDSYSGYNWVATPPYYHGEAWVDILFTAEETKKHKLSEILGSITSQFELRFDKNNNAIGNNGGYYANGAIRDNMLNITDTLVLDGRARIKSVDYDPETGQAITIKDDPSSNHSAYVIHPKWETPMFDFGNTGVRPITNAAGNLTIPTNGSESVPRGMWHQFGLPPSTPEKGIFLQATDVPQDWLDNHPGVNANTYNNGDIKSLVDLLGMDQSPRRLGEVSTTKTVSEAVVAIPFLESGKNKQFFSISKKVFKKAMNNGLGEDNSVQQMVNKLQKYVLPPSLDFITSNHIKPFAMYVFEFQHSFDKDDLIHIWQNLPPKSADRVEIQQSVISHRLLKQELLASDKMPTNLKWMVFKIKKKAVKNYFSKTASKAGDGLEDSRYKFEFKIAGRTKELDYSYNWPYDFFSLVEMVKIDAEVELRGDKEQ